MSVKVLAISHDDGSQITLQNCVLEMTIGEIKHTLISQKRLVKVVFEDILFYDSNNRVVNDDSHLGEWIKSPTRDSLEIPVIAFRYRISRKTSRDAVKATASIYGSMDLIRSTEASSHRGIQLNASHGSLSPQHTAQACNVCHEPTIERCGACARPTCSECASQNTQRRLSAVQMYLYQNRAPINQTTPTRPENLHVVFNEANGEEEDDSDVQQLIPGNQKVSSPIADNETTRILGNQRNANGSAQAFSFFLCPTCKAQRKLRASRKSIKYSAIIVGILLGMILIVVLISSVSK